MSKCDWCGTEAVLNETCDGDRLCQGCYELIEDDREYCENCGKPIEADPYCPICDRDLCEACYQKHLPACQKMHEVAKNQHFITEWI